MQHPFEARKRRFCLFFASKIEKRINRNYLKEIISEYYTLTEEKKDVNVIKEGLWNGNMLSLAISIGLHVKIAWYCQIQATEYHTEALIFQDCLQFVDLEKYRVIEIGNDFNLKSKRDLKILSNEKYFDKRFITDEITGKSYGIFPEVFKINGGYAYSVYFNRERQYGYIDRVKIVNDESTTRGGGPKAGP